MGDGEGLAEKRSAAGAEKAQKLRRRRPEGGREG